MFTFLLTFLVSVSQAERLTLNSASASELTTIEGVDEALAQRIVDLRGQRGTLSSVEALRVLNIPHDTLNSLRGSVSIELSVNTVEGQYTSVEQVLAEYEAEPPVRAVQAMAMSYARTNPELVDGWLNASRRAYLLPKLNLQYEKDLDLYQDFDYEADASGLAVEELEGARAEDDDKYVVRLEWRLDKLVMSSEQIRVINETQDIVQLRDKVLDEVTRLYFDRRRLQVQRLLAPADGLQRKIENELRLQELTANLDALTGGAFTAAL